MSTRIFCIYNIYMVHYSLHTASSVRTSRSRSYNLIQYSFTILGKVLHVVTMHVLPGEIKQS